MDESWPPRSEAQIGVDEGRRSLGEFPLSGTTRLPSVTGDESCLLFTIYPPLVRSRRRRATRWADQMSPGPRCCRPGRGSERTRLLQMEEPPIEEGGRLRTDSTRRRRGGPEQRSNLDHDRCRNAYANRTGRRKARENSWLVMCTAFVSRICYRPFDAVPYRDIASSTGTLTACAGVGTRQVTPKQRNTASTSRACGQLSSGDRAALAADGEADRIGQEIGR